MKYNRLSHLVLAVAAIAATAIPAGSAFAAKYIEASFETSTRLVPVPVTRSDTLLLANCKTCDKVSVRVTPATKFFIGDEEVTLPELREYTAIRPALLSCIYYSTPGRQVNRFVVARLEPVDGKTGARKVSATKKPKD